MTTTRISVSDEPVCPLCSGTGHGCVCHTADNDDAREEAWRSKAVVASDGNGNGCVIWYTGESIRNEIEEAGLHELGDLGLDDAPAGVSVWEGTYVWISGGYEHPADGEMVVSSNSAFRAPTEDEWAAIREKRNPWELLTDEGAEAPR